MQSLCSPSQHHCCTALQGSVDKLTLYLHSNPATVMECRGMNLPNRSSRQWLIIEVRNL